MTATKGQGTVRERRLGVWEIRVAAGTDPVSGRTIQRSVTFHGATPAPSGSTTAASSPRSTRRAGRLPRCAAVDGGRVARAVAGRRSPVEAVDPQRVPVQRPVRLATDTTLAGTRVVSLTPHQVRVAEARWVAMGASDSVIGGRFGVLRAAIGWAYDERIIDYHPIRHMAGPAAARAPATVHRPRSRGPAEHGRAPPAGGARQRQRLRPRRTRIATAANRTCSSPASPPTAAPAGANSPPCSSETSTTACCTSSRAESGGTITTPKSGRPLTLTLGATTARLWHTVTADWTQRHAPTPLGPWLFSADTAHHRRLTAGGLGHRFTRLRDDAQVPGAGLHRLRHNVATFLVARGGEHPPSPSALGHRDAATTLREYAYALPLTDTDVADALDDHLNRLPLTAHEALPTPPAR